jgi:hypothetical protein
MRLEVGDIVQVCPIGPTAPEFVYCPVVRVDEASAYLGDAFFDEELHFQLLPTPGQLMAVPSEIARDQTP